MSSKHLRGDFNFAFPSAEIGVRGPRGAIEILYPRDIAAAKTSKEKEALKDKLSKDYAEKFASPYQTAARGSVDEVIEPAQLRYKIIRTLKFLKEKRKPGTHENRGNIPL